MNNTQLTYATLMALTTHNVITRSGPNSTGLMQGTVINRNIISGDTVCCYEYNGSGLLRLGAIPAYNGDFFVDENSYMYFVQNGYLVIQNGLNGDIINNTIPAYGFGCNDGDGLCWFKSEQSTNTWTFIYYDGTWSNPVTLPFADTQFCIGCRNEIVAVAPFTNARYPIYLYSLSGTLINSIPAVGVAQWPTCATLYPINETYVGSLCWGTIGGIFDQATYTYYFVAGPAGITDSWFPFGSYYTPNIRSVENNQILGRDQAYFYIKDRLHDPNDGSILLNEWVTAKFSIDNFNGPIELDHRVNTDNSFVGSVSKFGHILRNVVVNETTTRNMLNISNLSVAYSRDNFTTPESMSNIRENNYFLWVVGSGVYQKIVEDWVMYSTSEYPRSEPYGKLGYAIANAKVGSTGTAVELFS